jgi:hypothetical protein
MLAPHSIKVVTPGKPKAITEGMLLHPLLVGSKERPLMKKEATLECNRLKRMTSDEKRDNPEMQGAQKKDLRWKKR